MRRFALGNNFSGVWGTEHSSTAVKNANLSVNTAKQSVPFTANSLSDSDVGFAFFIGDLGSTYDANRDWTVRLVENGTVVREQTFKITEKNSDEDGMYIVGWDTPFQYTSLSANYYWYEIVVLSGGGAGDKVMQDNASSSNFAYIGFNDVGTYLNTGDTLFIADGVTERIDVASLTLGTGIGTVYNSYNWNSAINICGQLAYDDTADTSLNIRGCIAIECGGTLGHETEILANKHTITFDYTTGASGDFGIFTRQICEIHLIGTNRPHETLNVSGNGTTADPLFILEDLGLVADDYIVISSTSAVLETEYKYIISGTFATGYVLADSVEGAESGFTNIHSSKAIIGSLTRNITLTTTAITHGWFFDENKAMNDINNINNSKFSSIFITRILNWYLTSLIFTNVVQYESIDNGTTLTPYHKTASVHENNIFVKNLNQTGGGDYLFSLSRAANFQVKNSLFIAIQVNAWQIAGYNNGLINCKLVDCNTDNDSNGGVVRGSTASKNYIRGCYFDANRSQQIRIRGNTELELSSCTFGDELPSPVTFRNDADLFTWNIISSNCTFNDISLALNMQSGLAGSEMRFHYCNLPAYSSNEECITYATEGIYQKCGKDSVGVDLVDPINRTNGNHSFAIKPNGTLFWNIKKVARAKDGVLMSWYFKTVNFIDGDLFRAELYLPGSTTPDNSKEWTSGFDYNWENGFVLAYFDGVLPQNSKIVISVKSTQPNAAVYITDLLNGENDITGLNMWTDAFPSETMYNISLSPMEVWGMLTSVPMPDGSYGKHLRTITNNNI